MKQLQKMENNKFTIKLIEVLQPEIQGNEDVSDEIFIVMEYFKFDLETLLSQSINFSEDHVKKIIYNILSALNFIHSANILHRDLKPSNILLDENCNVRICDFGLSRTMSVSSIEKGSGNSKRIRDSVMQFNLKEIIDD
jgi:mitogen-activated protein kinase 1/3